MLKEMFISKKIADTNSYIMDMYFTLNKKLDNFMDYLDIELVMNKLSEKIHKIAHISPLDADRFRDFNALYGFRTIYGTIEGQYEDFGNILEGVYKITMYILDIDNALSDAMELANIEKNDDYRKFISDEIEKLREYKKQFILLYDKIEKSIDVGNTLKDIDSRTSDYILMLYVYVYYKFRRFKFK